MKTCTKCKIEKDESCFFKDKSKKDGLHSLCKECLRAYRQVNFEKIATQQKSWRQSNVEQTAVRLRAYRQANAGPIATYKKVYQRNRLQTDPLYRTKSLLSRSIHHACKRKGLRKNFRTHKALGCSPPFFKLWLESQFTYPMSWANQGKYWQIDHIVPISTAKTIEDIFKLSHYTNLRPLPAKDNGSKSNKVYLYLSFKGPKEIETDHPALVPIGRVRVATNQLGNTLIGASQA